MIASALLSLIIIGCKGGDEDINIRTDAGTDTAVDTYTGGDTQCDHSAAGCLPIACRNVVPISGDISSSATWSCRNIYRLEGGPVYVTNNATLTIEAGTLIRGQVRDSTRRCTSNSAITCMSNNDCPMMDCGESAEQGTALIVTRGAKLVAEGTASAPIVFTSDRFQNGSVAPSPGDWGGVVLLGGAPTNVQPNPDQAAIEGLPPTEGRGRFGGADTEPNRAWDCGSMKYVRIEYAGFRFGTDNELNGLTVGGCGTETDLENIQVHRGLDDGIEFFGGNANLKYAVVTGTGDDSLDYDLGYRGKVQFFLAQQRNAPGEDRCMEIDNNKNGRNNTPITHGTVYNFTCIGPVAPGAAVAGEHDGVIFREGASSVLRNSIFVGLPDDGIRVQHAETVDRLGGSSNPRLTLEGNMVFRTGVDGMTDRRKIDDPSAGSGLSKSALEMAIDSANSIGTDPGFTAEAFTSEVTPNANPNFKPNASSATGAVALPSGDAFFSPAPYRGAIDPAATTLWYSGWTRFDN